MYSDKEKLVLKNILNAIQHRKVMKLMYYSAIKGNEKFRLVEPYSITETRRGNMVRLFQVDPVPGWRLFNLKLILSADETEQAFSPRRPSVQVGSEQEQQIQILQKKTQAQGEYQRMVLEAIADMRVTDEEAHNLAVARERLELSDDEVRGVLYKILADFLETLSADGTVSLEEVLLLKELNQCLYKIGEGRI